MTILGKIIELTTKIFSLASRVDRIEKDIERLQNQIDKLNDEMHRQNSKIDVLVYAVQAESDKTKMWVEKELMKFERRLASGKEEKK